MVKSGIYTTEFWVTAVVNIISAVVAILGVYGVTTAQEGDLWVALSGALASTVAPIVMAIVSAGYIKSRAEVKRAG